MSFFLKLFILFCVVAQKKTFNPFIPKIWRLILLIDNLYISLLAIDENLLLYQYNIPQLIIFLLLITSLLDSILKF